MASPTSNKASASARLVESNPQNPQAKKARREDGKVNLLSFIHDATVGLNLWVYHGIISEERKITLLSRYKTTDPKATLPESECENWCLQTLQDFANTYNNLEKVPVFLTFPEKLTSKKFREHASHIVEVYLKQIQTSLQGCAQAVRRNEQLIWIEDHEPFFPMRPIPTGQYHTPLGSYGVNVKFKILYEFCHKRLIVFRERQNAEDLDCVIIQLWRQESRRLVSLSIGYEALDWGQKIYTDLNKKDSSIVLKKKEFTQRIQRYVDGLKNICKKISQIDFETECFKATKPFDECDFPVTTTPKTPFDACIASALLIKNWMIQFQTQHILKEITEFSTAMQRVRVWAQTNLNGPLLKSEVEACDDVTAALL